MKMGGGSLLSMGQAEGYDKARKAIDQALHHPLLESANLYSAGGIIANFTGGPDLSFLEVTEALTYLQEMTGNQAEIIPGFITDDRMTDRAQVILVVTGLGGTAIDKELFQQKQPAPEVAYYDEDPVALPAEAVAPTEVNEAYLKFDFGEAGRSMPTAPEPPSLPNNLDLPAFLRRRARPNYQGIQ
jgi:cell division protein FtsZ